MATFLNLLIAIALGYGAGWLTEYVLARVGLPDPVKVLLAVVVGIIVGITVFRWLPPLV